MPTTDSAASITSSDGDEVPLGSAPPVTTTLEFSQIYRNYFSFIWACARRLGVTEAERDDFVQDVFITISARLPTLQQPESLRAWIYGIVRRTASTYHRTKRTKDSNTSAYRRNLDLVYPQSPSPQDLTEQTDQVKLLWALLEKLDPLKREVFVLAELDEMTVPEISSAIEVPTNTVYSRLRSARQELEEALMRHNARISKRGRPCPT